MFFIGGRKGLRPGGEAIPLERATSRIILFRSLLRRILALL
jgi:hypothetical protein